MPDLSDVTEFERMQACLKLNAIVPDLVSYGRGARHTRDDAVNIVFNALLASHRVPFYVGIAVFSWADYLHGMALHLQHHEEEEGTNDAAGRLRERFAQLAEERRTEPRYGGLVWTYQANNRYNAMTVWVLDISKSSVEEALRTIVQRIREWESEAPEGVVVGLPSEDTLENMAQGMIRQHAEQMGLARYLSPPRHGRQRER